MPRCKLQVNLAKKPMGQADRTLTCPARQVMFWAESSQFNSSLFNRVVGQVEMPAGQVNFKAACPAQQVMFWNLFCTLCSGDYFRVILCYMIICV